MDCVSIIMPSFNTRAFIALAIDSVLAQTYPYWELLIVDDGSSDGSAELIRTYCDERIKLFALEQNRGPDFVRNLALQEARGRYIAFLDSDDFWERDKLEKQVAFMQSKQTVLSYSAYWVVDEDGHRLGQFSPRRSIDYQAMLETCEIGNSTAMYDSQILGKLTNGTLRHDYELWLKILKTGVLAHCVEDLSAPPPLQLPCLASIRIRKGSDTYNKFKSAKLQWRVYREVEKLSFFSSLYYFCSYCFYGIKKRLEYFGGIK